MNSVRVAGEFKHVSRGALEQVVADQITRGFFEVDVEAVRVCLPRASLGARSIGSAGMAGQPCTSPSSNASRWRAGTTPRSWRTMASFFASHGKADEVESAEVLRPCRERARSPGSPWAIPDRAWDRWAVASRACGYVERGGWRLLLANGTTLVLADGQDAATLKRFARAAAKEIAEHLGSDRAGGSSLCGRFRRALENRFPNKGSEG